MHETKMQITPLYSQARISPAEECVNFRIGYPALTPMLVNLIKKCTHDKISNIEDSFFLYGVAEGYPEFRKQLANFAKFIAKKDEEKENEKMREKQKVTEENEETLKMEIVQQEEEEETEEEKEAYSVSSVMPVHGASGGVDIVCRIFTRPNDTIIVEKPTYFLARKIFEDHKLNIVEVSMDEDGVNMEEFRQAVEKHKPKLFYTIPVGHNPTGRTTCEKKRKEVISLAKKHNFKILADEVYQLLNFPDVYFPPPYYACETKMRLQEKKRNSKEKGSQTEGQKIVDEDKKWEKLKKEDLEKKEDKNEGEKNIILEEDEGVSVSIGSFSKIVAPALRLGWIQTSPKNIQRILECGVLRSGGCLNPIPCAIIHQMFLHNDTYRNKQTVSNEHEFTLFEHINYTRKDLHSKYLSMQNALSKYIPKMSYTPPQGGYFVYGNLSAYYNYNNKSASFSAWQLLKLCEKKYKVSFLCGEDIKGGGGRGEECSEYIRLSFSLYKTEEIEEGIRRLGEAIKCMCYNSVPFPDDSLLCENNGCYEKYAEVCKFNKNNTCVADDR